MKISKLSLLVLLVSIFFILATSSSNPSDFIRRSCSTTQYPDDCYKSLINYAPSVRRSPRQLANAALSVSISRVRSVSTTVNQLSARPKPNGSAEPNRSKEDGAVQDCVESLNDCLDQLMQSVREMIRMGRAKSGRFKRHLSNVQTKVSAALTYLTTCSDSVTQSSGPRVKSMICKEVVPATKATSNALALVNQLAKLT